MQLSLTSVLSISGKGEKVQGILFDWQHYHFLSVKSLGLLVLSEIGHCTISEIDIKILPTWERERIVRCSWVD